MADSERIVVFVEAQAARAADDEAPAIKPSELLRDVDHSHSGGAAAA
jgi:hypothetical protein